ncbi:hypothetical protein ACS0TY_012909 [Phlomoides rotata]
MACYLIHNYIRTHMEVDPLENGLDEFMNDEAAHAVLDNPEADNGFRCGFQRELEKGMRKLLVGTDIVANPHINFKIHVWKKEYGALSDLLSKSGIGWNSTTNTIDVLDETVWDAQKKADPHVKGVRFKTWSYYTHWIEIFGKDRATGENAVDPIDLVNDLYRTTYE